MKSAMFLGIVPKVWIPPGYFVDVMNSSEIFVFVFGITILNTACSLYMSSVVKAPLTPND